MFIKGVSFGYGIAIAFIAMFVVSCSNTKDKDVAGIEVGNPSIAFTAEFSIDYSEVSENVLAKSPTKEEPLLLDSFALSLFEVRSYSSYYVAISIDATLGVKLWPEESYDSTLLVSFTETSLIEEPFKDIDLDDGGYLKEVGISFKPQNNDSYIKGRILIEGSYIPIKYSLSWLKTFQLRYHFSQLQYITDNLVNLSVAFYPRYFVNDVDFSEALISDDGIIYFDESHNTEIWNKLNENFVPSFRSLRYDYTNLQGEKIEAYVADIWNGIIGSMTDNIIKNGDFSQEFEKWILFNQFGGKASSSIIDESSNAHIAKIQVIEGGIYSYSTQLIQENVALLANKKYKCVFTIWSDIEGFITARIGAYDDYETVGFQEHVKVETSGKSVEIEFSPSESTPFARFELNLGTKERTFYIKDIKIYRIEE